MGRLSAPGRQARTFTSRSQEGWQQRSANLGTLPSGALEGHCTGRGKADPHASYPSVIESVARSSTTGVRGGFGGRTVGGHPDANCEHCRQSGTTLRFAAHARRPGGSSTYQTRHQRRKVRNKPAGTAQGPKPHYSSRARAQQSVFCAVECSHGTSTWDAGRKANLGK